MLLSDYDDRHFLKEDGTYDLTTNVEVITRLTVERYHLQLNGEKTMFGENMVFLPFDYLCAKSLEMGEILRSENTFTIHHLRDRGCRRMKGRMENCTKDTILHTYRREFLGKLLIIFVG